MTEEVRLHFFDGISVFLWKIEQEQMVATSVYTFLLIVESRTLPPLPPSLPPPPHTHTHYPHTPCCVIAMIFKLIRVHYGCFFHPTDRKNMKYKQKFSMVDDFISHIYKGLHWRLTTLNLPYNSPLFHLKSSKLEKTKKIVAALLATYVALKIIKIYMTPWSGAEVNQFDACTFANVSSNIPEFSNHGLMTFSSDLFHHLENDRWS